jgi:hypothetical protein
MKMRDGQSCVYLWQEGEPLLMSSVFHDIGDQAQQPASEAP